MTPYPATTEPDPAAPEGGPDTQYYRRILHEMIDLGADLARLVHQQARQQLEAPASNDNRRLSAADYAAAFDRIARAVRRTILLARSLDAPPRLQAAAPQPRIAARKRVLRAIEDVIHRDADPADAAALHAELLDRLDAPEFDEEISGRDIAEVIREIRADLGLDRMPGVPPDKRRTPADLAILHARAAAPSRPATAPPPPVRAAASATVPSPAGPRGSSAGPRGSTTYASACKATPPPSG